VLHTCFDAQGTIPTKVIVVKQGRLVVRGSTGNDLIVARDRDPLTIYGRGGNDCIISGEGHDIIFGGAGDDVIFANRGRDIVWGGDGTNTVWGYSRHYGFGPQRASATTSRSQQAAAA